ncbi:MAG: RNA-binding protein, partial [Ignavibacteria bacterium RBG_13_36_8]
MNIYVGNLAPTVNEKDLENEFAKHGQVSSAKIIRDMFTQQSKGFGFVEMPSTAEAQAAIKELNTYELQGKRIIVN